MKLGGMAKAAGMIAAFTILSKVLGFVREASLAAVFGATRATDAYLMGQTIPGVVFALVGAALGTTFIPVYAQVRQERGREGAHAMADSVITATALAALAVIAFGEVAAPWLTRLVAPGFRGEVYALTVNLTRVLFPMVAFQGTVTAFMAGAAVVYGRPQASRPGSGVIARSVRLFGAFGSGVLVYVWLTLALGVPEAWSGLETGRLVAARSWSKVKPWWSGDRKAQIAWHERQDGRAGILR